MKQSKDIRAVFLDLDGTLLRGADTISERNLRALRRIQERGVIPVIATGRPAGETDFAVRATGADRYLIVMNGLAVYEDYRTRTLLHEAHLSDEAVELIIPWLLEQHIFFEAYIGERSVCQRRAAEWIQTCGMSEDQIRFFPPQRLPEGSAVGKALRLKPCRAEGIDLNVTDAGVVLHAPDLHAGSSPG